MGILASKIMLITWLLDLMEDRVLIFRLKFLTEIAVFWGMFERLIRTADPAKKTSKISKRVEDYEEALAKDELTAQEKFRMKRRKKGCKLLF